MSGGVRSMKGEKHMIYKNIKFKADPFSYDLEFDDRITLVGGDSATGKTVLYEILEDLRLTEEYRNIKLFNYKSDNFSESLMQCRGSFIVIDNADILINNEIRRFINFEFSNQYMLFLRNCDGLNVVRIDISHRTCRHIPCPGFVISPHFVCVNGNTINYV